MNKNTLRLFNYMVSNPKWISRIKETRQKYPNYKDFYNESCKIVLELIQTEKQFYDYPKDNVNIKKIVDMYF